METVLLNEFPLMQPQLSSRWYGQGYFVNLLMIIGSTLYFAKRKRRIDGIRELNGDELILGALKRFLITAVGYQPYQPKKTKRILC